MQLAENVPIIFSFHLLEFDIMAFITECSEVAHLRIVSKCSNNAFCQQAIDSTEPVHPCRTIEKEGSISVQTKRHDCAIEI